ncbi:MAG: hypothetical protein WC606_03790 [Candidatus Absconditabacterales bacterium]|jgi:hypothetical protein
MRKDLSKLIKIKKTLKTKLMKAERCNELGLALLSYEFLREFIEGTKPFIDSPTPLKKTDEIIGELNLFEKAIWSAARDDMNRMAAEIFKSFLDYLIYKRIKPTIDLRDVRIRKGFIIVKKKIRKRKVLIA